jgi:hypothetical protein
MSKETYTASKSRSNRPGWSIGFRHPLRVDSKGRPGLKMRRGLGTSDEGEANAMVDEMNVILGDQSWWNAAKRKEAELRFSKPVVEAFYDEIQAGRDDPEALRESNIRLPNAADDGYSRVLFVGTTGAGKTSLLRQLIGSDPDQDRFPSTSSAKTTIADIEVIQAGGDFEAVVTFFTEFQTQANIEECVTDAALAVLERAPIEKVADRFLNHRDQKFRIGYLLGSWRSDGRNLQEDDLSFDEADEPQVFDDEGSLTEEERAGNHAALEKYLERIKNLAGSVAAGLADEVGLDHASGADRDAAQELIEENFEARLTEDGGFHELVQDILEDVRSRFDFVGAGELVRRRSGWPELWLFKSDDRDEFIRHIRWFSSNYWPQFGRLLTPLVEGIRVRGPLFAKFIAGQPKLALIDGQGLGHTPDSSASVTTRVTRRFPQVDVILLVDNAQQPMQAAPLSVLRAVASSGHHDKLAIAFTHFDQIKGHNLPTFVEKRAHVMASVLNALSSLRDVLGISVVNAIEQNMDSRCFMLGGVDRQLAKLRSGTATYMRDQLMELVRFFEAAIISRVAVDARPEYDPTGIGFAVQEAVTKFQGPWLAKLGMGSYEGFSKEHWTRVKALNRRIAGEQGDEYDTLRPVADLVMQLREAISRFLNTPIGWSRKPADDKEEQAAIAHIRQKVDIALHDLAVKRLVEAHLAEWRIAYDEYRGPGSTRRRAVAIHGIYDAAAPLPDAVMTSPSVAFLSDIRKIVRRAIEENGGKMRLSEAA